MGAIGNPPLPALPPLELRTSVRAHRVSTLQLLVNRPLLVSHIVTCARTTIFQQHGQFQFCQFAVCVLGPLFLCRCNQASWPVCRAYSAIGLVDMLSSRTACSHRLKVDVDVAQVWHVLWYRRECNTDKPIAALVPGAKRTFANPEDRSRPLPHKGWLHRKGAAPADCGLVVIPGSRGDFSYLVEPVPDHAEDALCSLAHGAGRKWSRKDAHVYFITNQFAAEKDKAKLQDQLSEEYPFRVVILDRSWIVAKVYENGHLGMAISALAIEGAQSDAIQKFGPRDAARSAELTELDKQTSDSERYVGARFQLASDCFRSAILARGLERPQAEVEARFEQAIRIADELGRTSQASHFATSRQV